MTKEKKDKAASKNSEYSIFKEIRSFSLIVFVTLICRASCFDHYHVPTGSMIPTILINDRVIVDKKAFGLRVPATSWYLWRYNKPKNGEVVIFRAKNQSCISSIENILGANQPKKVEKPFRNYYEPFVSNDSQNEGCVLIKRVIGIEGDTISADNDTISLNGKPLPLELVQQKSPDRGKSYFIESFEDQSIKHFTLLLQNNMPVAFPDEITVPKDHIFVMGDNRRNSRDGRFFGFIHLDNVYGRAYGIYRRGDFKWWQIWKNWTIPLIPFQYEEDNPNTQPF